jgi:hypothetical protein
MSSSPRLPRAALAGVAILALIVAPAASAQALVDADLGAPIQTSAGDTIAAFVDVLAHLVFLGAIVESSEQPAHDRYRDDDDWGPRYGRRHRDAREGFLFSFGLGGGSMLVSPMGRAGSLQGNLRLGYGFSDRFQFFFDLTGAGVDYGQGNSSASWIGTMRGQTVLIGDRRGNGLNLNFGIGLGGNTKSYNGYDVDYRAGFALAGGLSFDARLSRSFALEPEFFVWWHAVPNDNNRPSDLASAFGLQLNFLWYGP